MGQITAVNWYGGKSKMAKQIIGLMESTRYNNYVEVFGGGGHVLLNKKRDSVEVYNDINKGLVSLFSVLRDTQRSKILLDQLQLTLYSHDEFRHAKLNWDKNITQIDLEIENLTKTFNSNFIDVHQYQIEKSSLEEQYVRFKSLLHSNSITEREYSKSISKLDSSLSKLETKFANSTEIMLKDYKKSLSELEEIRKDVQIETARMFYTICQQSFSGALQAWRPDKSTKSMRYTTLPMGLSKWLNGIDSGLPRVVERLKTVQIENISYEQLIAKYDSPDTLFYFDPPYIQSTRGDGAKDVYMYEFTDTMHVDLVKLLQGIQGKYILSGYDHPIYDALDDSKRQLSGTQFVLDSPRKYTKVKLDSVALYATKETYTDSTQERDYKEEYLWINFTPGSK